MQISSSSSNDIGTIYTIKLNDKQRLVVEEDEESKKAQKNLNSKELTEGEEQFIQDLETRDAEVKAHEAAHQAAGGGMTGAASYTYQQGPDGKMYAIGGEVPITIPSGSTPEESIKNARQAIAAAMAVNDPSPADYAVASSARMMEMQAQQQKRQEMQEEMQGREAYSTDSSQTDSSSKDENYSKLDISA